MKKRLPALLIALILTMAIAGVATAEDVFAPPVDAVALNDGDRPLPAEAADLTPGLAEECPQVSAAGDEEGIACDSSNFPDQTFRAKVSKQYDKNHDGVLSRAEREAVTKISIGYDNVRSLVGIDFFPNLEVLDCIHCPITELDASSFPALSSVGCYENDSLTSLTIRNCPNLTNISAHDSALTTLIVEECPSLKLVDVENNRLTSLKLPYTPDMVELNCQNNRLEVLTFNAPNLQHLACYNNRLTSLNLGDCAGVGDVYAANNRLTSLDLSRNIYLFVLDVSGSDIRKLDLSNCPDLASEAFKKPVFTSDGNACFSYFGENTYHIAVKRSTALVVKGVFAYSGAYVNGAGITVKNQTYTGSAVKPAVTVKLHGETLKNGRDYTVTYKKNVQIGTATVTIAGTGRYRGSAKAHFTIKPKAVSGLNVKAGASRFTVRWKKRAGVTGYELQYSRKSDFSSSAKLIRITGASTTRRTIKNLKRGKTYYARIRAYKTVNGKKYRSAWSAAKKVTIP